MWVKTCFLGKGLSPSKLSTKALCGDTRKREREAVLSKIRFPSRPSTDIVSGSTSNQQRVRAAVPNLFFFLTTDWFNDRAV